MDVQRRGSTNSSINVTPLIDVTLVLLIAFMVVTPFIVYSFTADLPMTGVGVGSAAAEEEVVVHVTADNAIQLNGKAVGQEELGARIDELFPQGTRRERKVVFEGDRQASYVVVIRVMDLLRLHGIEAIGVR